MLHGISCNIPLSTSFNLENSSEEPVESSLDINISKFLEGIETDEKSNEPQQELNKQANALRGSTCNRKPSKW